MPANEQTLRDPKRMHRIFAISSVVMLVATMWMFVADHNREWKVYQKTSRTVETKMTNWRQLQFRTEEAFNEHARLQSELTRVRSRGVDRGIIDAFSEELASEARRLDVSEPSFDSVSKVLEKLEGASSEATESRNRAADLERDRSGVEGKLQQATGDERKSLSESLAKSTHEAKAAAEEAVKLELNAGDLRKRLIDALQAFVVSARFREDQKLGERKFRAADLDAARAELDLAIRDHRQELFDPAQRKIDVIRAEVQELSLEYQARNRHRLKLQDWVRQIRVEQDDLSKKISDSQAELARLQQSNVDRRSEFFTGGLPGKKWLELPVLEAFNSPLKIDNLWSDGLLEDYNHKRVRRFDRCTTCHQAIQKTLPGSAVEAAYEEATEFELVVDMIPSADAKPVDDDVERFLGLQLATEGLLNPNDVTVTFVQPHSRAAQAQLAQEASDNVTGSQLRSALVAGGIVSAASPSVVPGLMVGDVILEIDGDSQDDAKRALVRLRDTVRKSARLAATDKVDQIRPVILRVRRGLPNPYASHPRLDLFVGSMSPHQSTVMACTVCHDGQGSATEFKWASHTPNTIGDKKRWGREHGWFDNPHWIYPMFPARFAESACLKCHHNVTELEPSNRFPDPPAPKVVHGHRVIQRYGCFGCHEINGYDGSRRIGPDLRAEPNYFAAALQLKYANGSGFDNLTDAEKGWVEELITHPEQDETRHRLYEVLVKEKSAENPRLSSYALTKLAPVFKDIDSPGRLRKVGPSLRFLGSKVDDGFLVDWLREPKHFRPTTRMPQFFELTKHLGDAERQPTERFERVEILGLAAYLKQYSQPFELPELPGPNDPAEAEASVARGKVAFEERGCLACHAHRDFAAIEALKPRSHVSHAPDLTGLGSKFGSPKGRRWLYSWIKNPSKYHARTTMPDLFLGAPDKDQADTVKDVVEYLVSSVHAGWEPKGKSLVLDADGGAALDEVVAKHLEDAFQKTTAEEYLVRGIPARLVAELKGAETELVVPDDARNKPGFALGTQAKLAYVGRKSIAKYGCFGCHDIPGFEDAKPIGTTLADWGRKDPSRLAFEHISHYLPGGEHAHGSSGGHGGQEHGAHGAGTAEEAYPDYFRQQVLSGNRTGFLYHKLREPRSFDFRKTENKSYNERLRMPQFPFDAEEREAVVTFVLGLVADPPSERFLYRPDARQAANIAGRQVIEKYNCGGCHVLSANRWQIAYTPDSFGAQRAKPSFPFVMAHESADVIARSSTVDRRNQRHATLYGMPVLNDLGQPIIYDANGDLVEDGDSLKPRDVEYAFQLWRPAVLDGSVFQVGELPLSIKPSMIENTWSGEGGLLAKYLVPVVSGRERSVNPNAKGSEAWAWVPPPLVGEGAKVQSDWLHDFLLDPHPIRPAVVLRMPKFNMTSKEARDLVAYFSAVDDSSYPYEYREHRRDRLRRADVDYAKKKSDAGATDKESGRLDDAMRLLVDGNYCVKCHLVADFSPSGADRAKAPNLAEVYRRLRGDYVRKWIARPLSILPYTSMPVNIPYDPADKFLGGVKQDLYHGTSVEQVDAVVDLLMNFDEFAKGRNRIAPLVKPVPAAPAAQPASESGN